MNRNLTLIPLRITPYSDRNSILSAYSREMGKVSCLLPAGAGRESRRRRALLMPFCPVRCQVSVSPGRDVMPMREPVAWPPLPLVSADPMRCVMALFVSEVLQCVLRQSESEPVMFDFIADSAVRLNSERTSVANFHIVFLIRLLGYLGVAPDLGGYRTGMVFDMADACFRVTAPLHGRFLMPDEAAALARLGRIDWRNAHIYKYTRAQRARVLDVILQYYTLHVADLSGLKSVDVLRGLFD
ncbi:MAG: DNA repair protein RecO [Muribaculaceae bacterium]|nr:DNA repair protein RecO [Muribaculaceae bacterium]